jgi:SAM-dependent methyltransferase
MTDWENRYQVGDTPWEKGLASPPLVDLLGKFHDWGHGQILVPGCGLGHDVRALAALGMVVLGLDLSPTAVARAQEFEQAGAENYEVGDFLEPAWRVGREFSAIWEHTCFCAIDPGERARYAAAAAGCLAEGGLLAGVFFLTPFDPGEAAVGPPFAVTLAELEVLFSPWFERVAGWVPDAAYPGREGREWLGLFRKLAQA